MGNNQAKDGEGLAGIPGFYSSARTLGCTCYESVPLDSKTGCAVMKVQDKRSVLTEGDICG